MQLWRFFICQASSFWRGLVGICNWKERQRVREVFWLKKVLTGFKSHKTHPRRQIKNTAAARTWDVEDIGCASGMHMVRSVFIAL